MHLGHNVFVRVAALSPPFLSLCIRRGARFLYPSGSRFSIFRIPETVLGPKQREYVATIHTISDTDNNNVGAASAPIRPGDETGKPICVVLPPHTYTRYKV